MAKKTIDPAKAAQIAQKKAAKEKPAPEAVAETKATETAEPAKPAPAAEPVEGKLAKIRRLRAEGFTRKQILEDHRDNNGEKFNKITVAIQCANVEHAKLDELGPNASDEARAQWLPPVREPKAPKEKPAPVEGAEAKPKASRKKKAPDAAAVPAAAATTEAAAGQPAAGVKVYDGNDPIIAKDAE